MVKRVERHIIRNPEAAILDICHKAKNLYNYVNYIIRQHFFAGESIPCAFDLINQLTKENQVDYRALPAQTAQQVILLLCQNWKSFFFAIAEFSKNPSKYHGKPKIPKYKKKDGFSIAIFTNQNSLQKNGKIHFPKKVKLQPLPTKVENYQQIRIIPQATCFVIEVVYQTEIAEVETKSENVLAIDLGLNNFATCVNNVGQKPFIVNGRILKSINQFYNKTKALLMSFVGNKGSSNRIKQLTFRRNQKIDDAMHKISAYIRDWCVSNKIGLVIIGKNAGWKQNSNMGKRNNQNFVSIPYNKLISQLQYKLSDIGIRVIITEESYTSKVDHLYGEDMKHQECYRGKRLKRGLFQSSTGRLLNADVNGAIGIGRKVIGNAFVEKLLDRGDGLSPVRINIF